jgi:hypothetical protein
LAAGAGVLAGGGVAGVVAGGVAGGGVAAGSEPQPMNARDALTTKRPKRTRSHDLFIEGYSFLNRTRKLAKAWKFGLEPSLLFPRHDQDDAVPWCPNRSEPVGAMQHAK